MLTHPLAQRIERGLPESSFPSPEIRAQTQTPRLRGSINNPILADTKAGMMANKQTAAVPRILRPCPTPGCPELTTGGPCEARRRERQQEQDARRGKTTTRGYGADWRRLRLAKLTTDPVCEIRTCQGLVASEVDHKIPIRDWPDGRLEWSNLSSACKPCHSAKTALETVRRMR